MERNLIFAMIVVSVAGLCLTASTASGDIIYQAGGTADEYTVSGYGDISYSPSPFYNRDMAVAFTVPLANDYFLTTIDIGLAWYSGADSVDVWLKEDNGGKPGEQIVESFLASGLPTYGSPPSYKPTTRPFVHLTSAGQYELEADTTYWVVASGRGVSGIGAYWLSTTASPLSDTGLYIDYLDMDPSWKKIMSDLPPALRISGNVVPLPGAVWLLGTGLLASAGLLRRLRP